MAQTQIDFNDITEVYYNGSPLTELSFDTQTVWTRPFVSGGSYDKSWVNDTTINSTSTWEPAVSSVNDKTNYPYGFGDAGTINEMSQDGTIIAYNFRDRIIVISRPNTNTDVWALRDTITTYGPEEDQLKAFAMNHDGSIIVTGIGKTLTIFSWNGSSYVSSQTIVASGPASWSGGFLKIEFCHTLNAFVADARSADVGPLVYGSFGGSFYPLGDGITRGFNPMGISDGGLNNTSTQYDNIHVAVVQKQISGYPPKFLVYKLVNNKWVQKGNARFLTYSQTSSLDWEQVSTVILSKDGNRALVSGRHVIKKYDGSSFSTLRYITYLLLEYNPASNNWEQIATIPELFQPYSLGPQVRVVASDDLSTLAVLGYDYDGSVNMELGTPYKFYVQTYSGGYWGGQYYSYRVNSVPTAWSYQRDGYNLTYTSRAATPWSYVHGGLSISADSAVLAFNSVQSKASDGSDYELQIFRNEPSYHLTTNSGSMFETGSVQITLTTVGLANSNIPYTITGIQAADIQEPLTGNFATVNRTATITLNAVADATAEGNQTLTLTLDNGQASIDIDILDTSV